MIVRLFVYGIQISIRVPRHLPEVVDSIRHDFSEFLRPRGAVSSEVRIFSARRLRLKRVSFFSLKTGYSRSGGWKTKRIAVGPRCEIAIRGRSPYFAAVQAESAAELYEMIERVILSSVGELLDARGIHRVHAFSFHFRGRSAVVCGAPRTGKSYLAARANQDREIRILSDEVTLLDTSGLKPFPMAISTDSGEGHCIQRKGGPRKVRQQILRPQLETSNPALLVFARRSFEPGKIKLAAPTFLQKMSFVLETGLGLGQMQMVEFTLRRDIMLHLPAVFVSRCRSALALLRDARAVAITLPENIGWREFQDVMANQSNIE